MVAIQLISDLHLEVGNAYDSHTIAPRAPILALLGDIGLAEKHREAYLQFLARQLPLFKAVLLVPGNHEAYHGSWPKTTAVLRGFETELRLRREEDPGLGEFVLMDRGRYVAGEGVVVLGCSLFSRVPGEMRGAVEMGLMDFYVTGGWDVGKHNEAHERDLEWLNENVESLEGQEDVEKIVIISHWSPSTDPRSIEPRHFGSRITTGFSTDLRGQKCWESEKVKVWGFGHTHYNSDFVASREKGDIRVVGNQHGYPIRRAEGYDGEKVIEV